VATDSCLKKKVFLKHQKHQPNIVEITHLCIMHRVHTSKSRLELLYSSTSCILTCFILLKVSVCNYFDLKKIVINKKQLLLTDTTCIIYFILFYLNWLAHTNTCLEINTRF